MARFVLDLSRGKNMIRVNIVAIGRCPRPGDVELSDENSYILESSWGSEALLAHFLGLLGLGEKPAREQRLNSALFDIEGLRRMSGVCGDYAELIDAMIALHHHGFSFFIAGSLVRRNFVDSSPNDVELVPETRCRSARAKLRESHELHRILPH